MGKPWDVKLTGKIGKILPNEISKMSSVLKFIPYIGQALQIVGAADAGATTYSDVYDVEKEKGASEGTARARAVVPAFKEGFAGHSTGTNPGKYGSGGNIDRDWADYVGMAGNLYGSLGGGDSDFNLQGTGGNIKEIYGAASGKEDKQKPKTGLSSLTTQSGSATGSGNPLVDIFGGMMGGKKNNQQEYMDRLFAHQQEVNRQQQEKRKEEELILLVAKLLEAQGINQGANPVMGGTAYQTSPFASNPFMKAPVTYGY